MSSSRQVCYRCLALRFAYQLSSRCRQPTKPCCLWSHWKRSRRRNLSSFDDSSLLPVSSFSPRLCQHLAAWSWNEFRCYLALVRQALRSIWRAIWRCSSSCCSASHRSSQCAARPKCQWSCPIEQPIWCMRSAGRTRCLGCELEIGPSRVHGLGRAN